MTSVSLHDIRKELQTLDVDTIRDLCVRLARYKKESKELLAYLLFDAHDEPGYVEQVKGAMEEMFHELPAGNLYFVKKSLRKILRFVNRQIKYSDVRTTEVELRLSFCVHVKSAGIPLADGSVLFNIYQRQLSQVANALAKLPEDVRADYQRELGML